MKTNENQSKKYRIYLKAIRQWVEVSETVYLEHIHFYDAFRKKAQFHGQCICPKRKFWLCDGDCYKCEFRCAGDTLSLDFTVENEKGGTFTPSDIIPDKSPMVDEIGCDKATLEQLFNGLAEIMPEARRIGELRLAGLSDTQIAKIIGIPRTTFLYHLEKAAKIIQSEYPEMF